MLKCLGTKPLLVRSASVRGCYKESKICQKLIIGRKVQWLAFISIPLPLNPLPSIISIRIAKNYYLMTAWCEWTL